MPLRNYGDRNSGTATDEVAGFPTAKTALYYFCTAGSNNIDTELGAPSAPQQTIACTCGPPPGPPLIRSRELLELTKWKSCIDTLSEVDGGGGLKIVTELPGLMRQARSRGALPASVSGSRPD